MVAEAAARCRINRILKVAQVKGTLPTLVPVTVTVSAWPAPGRHVRRACAENNPHVAIHAHAAKSCQSQGRLRRAARR